MTAIETVLLNVIVSKLRKSGLKDGNIRVRTINKGFDLVVLTTSKLPAIEIGIEDQTDETLSSDSRIGDLSLKLIAWVRGIVSSESQDRARDLRNAIRKAIRADDTLGAAQGVFEFNFDLHDLDYGTPYATGMGMTIRCNVTEAK